MLDYSHARQRQHGPKSTSKDALKHIEATVIQDRKRKRKRDDSSDKSRVTRDDSASRDIHLFMTRRGTEASNRRQDSVQSSKRPYLDPSIQLGRYTVEQPSNSHDCSTATPPSQRNGKQAKDEETPTPKVNRAYAKPSDAHEEASEDPNLLDWEAWQRLVREPRPNVRKQNADMYQSRRQCQYPKRRDFIDWKAVVVQEMRELGFDSRLKRSKVGDELGVGKKEEVVKRQETLEVQKAAEVQEKKVEQVEKGQYEDDGFDVDIYGDEEMRREYKPWIRSRMGQT